MNFEDDLNVEIILFEDENLKNLRVVFHGTAKDLRKIDKEWDDFEIGERFHLENQKVRVFRKKVFMEDQDSIPTHTYYVGPVDLNIHKIDFNEIE